MIEWLDKAQRSSPWPEARAVVAGLGARGYSAADVLLEMGAHVVVLDDGTHADAANLLELLGAEVQSCCTPDRSSCHPDHSCCHPDESQDLFADALSTCDLVIAPDEDPLSSRIVAHAEEAGVPVWSDVELAWRVQKPDRVVPWLGVTGTTPVGATVYMLEAMLASAGFTVSAVGSGGRPILETVLDEVVYDVLAVGMSQTDLVRSPSVRFHSAAILTLQSEAIQDVDQYARIYYQVTHSCLYNVSQPRTEAMVEEADVVEGARAIGITEGIPAISMLGVVDDLLVDRAFIPQRKDSALEVASVSDVPEGPAMIEQALVAAGLARSFGVPALAVRDGLRLFSTEQACTDRNREEGTHE